MVSRYLYYFSDFGILNEKLKILRRICNMDDLAIKVSNVDKTFRLPHEKQNSIKDLVVHLFNRKKTFEKQHVLKNINLEIKKGEFFGIVGKNGGGKSTMLKILAGIYSPNNGAVIVNGKLTAFIELGVGFNPNLTGRENVYLSGALLGFSEKEVSSMYDDIVDFAELKRFMDQKLKNYSSGMQVRLAFSIAIQAKSDILILDEVLAVGDEAFQRKCLDVFERYKSEKQTVILVTHDMETVRKFCSRALILDDGKILQIGEPNKVASIYSKLNLDEIERDMNKKDVNSVENNLGLKIDYKDQVGKSTTSYRCGATMRLSLTYNNVLNYAHLVINIYKRSGEHITGFRIPAESGSAEVDIKLLLTKGKYYILVQAVNDKHEAVGDVVEGNDFLITTTKPVGMPGWSGLVPVDYKLVK